MRGLKSVILALALAACGSLAQAGINHGSAGGSYSPEATALFAVMTSAPDSTRKGLIDTAIVCLKTASVWTKEDWLAVGAAGNSHDGLLNWVNPSKTLSIGGSVTFTTDLGFNIATSSASNYLLMPELLNAAGNNYAQDSAHQSIYLNAFAFQGFGTVLSDGSTNYNNMLGQFTGGNAFYAVLNANANPVTLTTGTDATAAHYLGMWSNSRTASNAQALYKGGAAVNGANSWTDTTASTGVPATVSKLLWGDGAAANNPPSATTRMAVFSSGTSFSSTDAANENSCLVTYLTAIGAN